MWYTVYFISVGLQPVYLVMPLTPPVPWHFICCLQSVCSPFKPPSIEINNTFKKYECCFFFNNYLVVTYIIILSPEHSVEHLQNVQSVVCSQTASPHYTNVSKSLTPNFNSKHLRKTAVKEQSASIPVNNCISTAFPLQHVPEAPLYTYGKCPKSPKICDFNSWNTGIIHVLRHMKYVYLTRISRVFHAYSCICQLVSYM